jgi:hypothetical protein
MDAKKISVRPQRSSLIESLREGTSVANRFELWELITKTVELPPMLIRAGTASLQITPYGFDERIGWNTYLITIPGYGVWGMSDGDVP